MSSRSSRCLYAVCVALLALWSSGVAAQLQDFRVQRPGLKAPERGSLAGQLSNVSFGASEVSRGTFSLPIAMELPEEEGVAGVSPFPSYSSEAGLSEWGLGFQNASLTIERFRQAGPLDFASDELRGPWGPMAKGSDGSYYPYGLRTPVRVQVDGATLVATLPDGSRHIFGAAPEARIDTARGTFAWYLTSVVSPLGRVTTLRYEQQRTGMPYLVELSFGGLDAQRLLTQVRFELETTRLTRDYRSGELRYRHRRVKRVIVSSRDGEQLRERYRYELGYDAPPASPAYHLVTVQRVFPSGESSPMARYEYGSFDRQLAAAQAVRNDVIYPVLTRYGMDVVSPERSSLVDVDRDGRLDLEVAEDGALYLQSDQGFSLQPTRTPAPSADPRCRLGGGLGRTPRNLVHLLPGHDEPQAVYFDYHAAANVTEVGVCTMTGAALSSTTLRGAYQPGTSVAYFDIDRDQLPDLVRVDASNITVLRNVSSQSAVRFVASVVVPRSPALTVDGLWVFDVNGDGLSDVVTRNGPVMRVHHGLSSGSFSSAGQLLQFVTRDGSVITEVANVRYHFFDVNRDGLADAIRQGPSFSLLYVNQGDGLLRGTPSTAVEGIGGFQSNFAASVDLTGTSESEVFFVSANRPMSLMLTRPDTGLLVAADDGAGTKLRFAYERAPAQSGVTGREVVLSSMVVESTGYGAVEHRYAYAEPVGHSVSRALIGFGRVERESAGETQVALFYHDDQHASLPTGTKLADAALPNLEKFEEKQYENASAFGLTFKRLLGESAGFRQRGEGGTREVRDRKTYEAYAHDVCPRLVSSTGSQGTLTTTTTYTLPAAFGSSLGCFASHVAMVGSHPADPQLDFSSEARVRRNERGQVTQVAMEGPDGPFVDQTIEYDDDFRMRSLTQTGQGTTHVTYFPSSDVVQQVIAPDGTSTRVGARDPVHRSMLELTTLRGESASTQYFRYDGQHRLFKHWSPITGASESTPNTELSYRYASADRPGVIRTRTLTRLSGSLGIYQEMVELRSAKDEGIASAVRMASGYHLTEIVVRDRSNRSERVRRNDVAIADPESLGLGTLLGLGREVRERRDGALGFALGSREIYHEDVTRVLSARAAVDDALRVQETENDAESTETELDAVQRVTARTDQAGNTWRYRYDALGRLRRIELPDGSQHASYFDAYGRLSRIVRDGVASVSYHYEPASGLLQERCFASPEAPGECVREVLYERDALGRAIVETHVDVASGDERRFEFFFDGLTPEGGVAGSQPGLLTGVRGQGYTRSFAYRADGLRTSERLSIAGYADVDRTFHYDPDGGLSGKRTVVTLASGRVVSDLEQGVMRDDYGRVSGMDVAGTPFLSLRHDAAGLLAGGDFGGPLAPDGASVDFTFDAVTRRVVGIRQRARGLDASFTQQHGARGLVESERVQVGDELRERSYQHDARRFLVSASDADDDYTYDYDENGKVVDTPLPVDALGRVTEHAGARLSYGPDGHVASVVRGAERVDFLYDESGARIARIVDGAVRAMYPREDEYFDAQLGLISAVRVGSMVVGVLAHGESSRSIAPRFAMVAVDLRGTVLSDSDGAPRIPSPYGVYERLPDLAHAVLFATCAYDTDLSAVRMGVRDYAPAAARFLTPDPKLLESLEEAQKSPVEGELYGYARNDPLGFVDPRGTTAQAAAASAGEFVLPNGARIVISYGVKAGEWVLGGVTVGGALAGATVVGIGLICLTSPPKATSVTVSISATTSLTITCSDPTAPQFRHHTIPQALLTVMAASGMINPLTAATLSSFAGIGLLRTDRSVHLSLHKLLTARLEQLHPGLKLTNGYQTQADWGNYLARLVAEHGGPGKADMGKVKFQMLAELGSVYAQYDMEVIGKGKACEGATDSAFLKFAEAAAAVALDPTVQMWHPPMAP